jgi:hypothetical protein
MTARTGVARRRRRPSWAPAGRIKFVGRPFTGTTDKVGRDADATGQRLHRGAKGFGEGLRDGLTYTGQKIGSFFGDSSRKNGR